MYRYTLNDLQPWKTVDLKPKKAGRPINIGNARLNPLRSVKHSIQKAKLDDLLFCFHTSPHYIMSSIRVWQVQLQRITVTARTMRKRSLNNDHCPQALCIGLPLCILYGCVEACTTVLTVTCCDIQFRLHCLQNLDELYKECIRTHCTCTLHWPSYASVKCKLPMQTAG